MNAIGVNSMRTNDRNIVFFRVDMIQPPVKIGDICDIVDGTKSIGKYCDFAGGLFTQVRVTDLSEELEEDLKVGVKRIIVPTITDPMYKHLLTGKVEIKESQLLPYVEVV